MNYRGIVAWVEGLCTFMRASQAKTLAALVVGAMRCRRASQAEIGRGMLTGTVVKHNIKRLYRFLTNERVEAPVACLALMELAMKAAKGMLLVAVDWVDIGPYRALRAAVPLTGRSVPVLFAAYRKWELWRSQNAFEEGFLRLMATMVPAGAQVVVIADRGFGRTQLCRTLQELGLGYIIRVRPDVWFSSPHWRGSLEELPVSWGIHKDLGFGRYRKTDPVLQRVIVHWKAHQKEPWFLATSLGWSWRKVAAAFALRMSIEELFRDEKNMRYGWGLRHTELSEPQRVQRLLLVLALAYLLLLLLGLYCRQTMPQSHWAAATSRKQQLCAFTIGRFMQTRLRVPLRILLALLQRTLAQIIKENWG